jgi:hypothetical protein
VVRVPDGVEMHMTDTPQTTGGAILCLRALAEIAADRDAHAMREAADIIRDQAAEIGRLHHVIRCVLAVR